MKRSYASGYKKRVEREAKRKRSIENVSKLTTSNVEADLDSTIEQDSQGKLQFSCSWLLDSKMRLANKKIGESSNHFGGLNFGMSA